MAGHALLVKITREELKDIVDNIKGVKISGLQHDPSVKHANWDNLDSQQRLEYCSNEKYADWSAKTKKVLEDGIAGKIIKRDYLPPHFYIEFPIIHYNNPNYDYYDEAYRKMREYLSRPEKSTWIERLRYPGIDKPNFSSNILKSITNDEKTFFKDKRYLAAFLVGVKTRMNYCLEVYYFDTNKGVKNENLADEGVTKEQLKEFVI